MNAQTIGLAGRAAGAYLAYKHLGARMPGGPVVAALLGWIVADLIVDRITG